MTLFTVMNYIILAALSTGLCSNLHGSGAVPKWQAVTLHLLMSPAVALIFWPVFRRHPQADAELDLFGDDVGNYGAVRKAYYIWPLGAIMARVMRYCMENPWPHVNTDGLRSQQEICGGFVVGGFLGILTAPIISLLF